MSHVRVSFEVPINTSDVDGLGTLRILDATKSLNIIDKVRFYQASTSELYGKVVETPQNEKPLLSKITLCSCKVICILDDYKL